MADARGLGPRSERSVGSTPTELTYEIFNRS